MCSGAEGIVVTMDKQYVGTGVLPARFGAGPAPPSGPGPELFSCGQAPLMVSIAAWASVASSFEIGAEPAALAAAS